MTTALAAITTPIPLGADRGLPFTVRTAAPGDLSFIDMLQKRHSHEVGFLPMVALENHVNRGRVAIGFENDEPAAYIIAKSPYQRDPQMGIMYQAAVEYSAQRRLLGTALVEHAISLLPVPVKLISAWVAQDIEANYFWESVGFEPIAARRGSNGRGRVHIFWQRRRDPKAQLPKLRHPKATSGGTMRARRVVRPIGATAAWTEIDREALPDAPEKHDASILAKQFRYGRSPWMCVIINGVSRYLPTPNEMELPGFLDPPMRSAPQVGIGGCAVPRSQIPGM